MQQVIYASRATEAFTSDELRTLLRKARTRNSSVGVTGCLLHIDGSFLQVLEGDAGAVDSVFQKIGKDGRHVSVVTLLRRELERPQFADWSMGFVDGTGTAATLEGYRPATGFADLAGDPSRIVQIVNAFKSGRWRSAA